MRTVSAAMNWLHKNSEKLGRQYKNQWLAIGPRGVEKHSVSYAKAAKAAEGKKSFVLIKIPKNPAAAYFY